MKISKHILIALTSIFCLYVLWSAYIPPFESPDEQNHVKYIHSLAAYLKLPVVSSKDIGGEYHQPPLYYAILAPVYRSFIGVKEITLGLKENWIKGPDREWRSLEDREGKWQHYNDAYRAKRSPLFILRLFNLIFVTGTLVLVYLTASIFFDKSPLLKYAMVFFVALIPEFSFINSAVNNDNMATFISMLTIFVMLMDVRGKDQTVPLGVLLGIAYLTKANDYFLILFVPLCILFFNDTDIRSKMVKIVKILSVFFVLSLPYSIYLYKTYGDPFGKKMLAMSLSNLKAYPAPTLSMINITIANIFDSFWAWFGWLSIRLAPIFYNLVTLFCLFSIIGLFRDKEGYDPYEKILALAFFLEIIYFIAVHFVYGLYVTGDQGRRLYVVIFPVCYFLLKGFKNILRPFKTRDDRFYLSVIIIMIALNIYSLIAMSKGLN